MAEVVERAPVEGSVALTRALSVQMTLAARHRLRRQRRHEPEGTVRMFQRAGKMAISSGR